MTSLQGAGSKLVDNLTHPFRFKSAADPAGLGDAAAAPPPIAPPPAPNADNGQAAMDLAALEQSKALARGRSATLLTGGAGLADLGTSSKTLLGR